MKYQLVFLLIGLFFYSMMGLSNNTYSADFKVFPLDGKINGFTYSDWMVNYFRWIASIPQGQNHPVLDKSGQYCSTYQSDTKIFYLVDALSGGPVSRQCTIPKDKPILINLLYSMCDEKVDREDFQVQPVNCVEDGLADTHITFSIDGVPFDGKLEPDINKFKIEPTFFNVSYVNGNYLASGGEYIPGKGYKAIIGAYMIILEPLPTGKHTIVFDVISGGCTENDPACSPYHVNVRYNLMIV